MNQAEVRAILSADRLSAQADHERAEDARQLLDTVDTYFFADEPIPQRITTQIPHRGRRFRVLVEPLPEGPVIDLKGFQ
jgi:hypothetical protein